MDTTGLLEYARPHLPAAPLFLTLSGGHLYGFASPDSDYDVRGAYVLPPRSLLGLERPVETVAVERVHEGREIDLVAHDLRKYLLLLLNRNGYILEQIYSPLVVAGSAGLEELRRLARGCITRRVYEHYSGFAHGQIKLLQAEQPPRIKTLLYVYRVLLSGCHVLETGEVEANLPRLAGLQDMPFLHDLIAQKARERATLDAADLDVHWQRIADLQARMEQAHRDSRLPEEPACRAELNDFLLSSRQEAARG